MKILNEKSAVKVTANRNICNTMVPFQNRIHKYNSNNFDKRKIINIMLLNTFLSLHFVGAYARDARS